MRARSLLCCLAAAVPAAAGLSLKSADGVSQGFDRPALVARAERALERNGLVRDQNSRVTVSGVQGAAVYRRPGCDGVLVVVPLPPTAQSFEHVVPVPGATASAEGFVFRGRYSETYPVLGRLAAGISGELRIEAGGDRTVFAFRELGHCNLSEAMDWVSMTLREV